jgi:hypothetical protein
MCNNLRQCYKKSLSPDGKRLDNILISFSLQFPFSISPD